MCTNYALTAGSGTQTLACSATWTGSSQLRKLRTRKEYQGLGSALSSDPTLGRKGKRRPSPWLGSGPRGQAKGTAGLSARPFRPPSSDLLQRGWKQNKNQLSLTPCVIPASWLISHKSLRCLVSGLPQWAAQETFTQSQSLGWCLSAPPALLTSCVLGALHLQDKSLNLTF